MSDEQQPVGGAKAMPEMPEKRSVAVECPIQCTVCGGRHILHGVVTLVRQKIVFGGGSDEPDEARAAAAWTKTLTCPRQRTSFQGSGLVPAGYNESVDWLEVEAITDTPPSSSLPATAVARTQPATDWIDQELAERRINTVPTQRAFATTMLTTSSGGVAIYFAVLKYLGWEQANFSAPLVILTVLPPTLFLLATIAFALALRPSLSYVDRDEYAEVRATRIAEIHRRVTAGTVLYVAALILAIAVFLALLEAVS